MGAGIWALVCGILTSRIVSTLILLVIQPWIVKPTLELGRVKGIITFGGTMTLAVAVATTGYMLPAIIAGPVIGAESLGIFIVSWQFALLPLSKISPAINPIIFPAFSKFQGQPDTIATYMEKSMGIASIILFPPIIGLACVASEFVPTILGEKWLPVVLPLIVLCISVPFRGLTSFMRQIMGGIGYPKLSLTSTIVTWSLLFFSIHFFLDFGFVGIAYAILISEIFSYLATIHLSKKVMSTSYSKAIKPLIPSVSSSLVMAVVVIISKYTFYGFNPLYLLILEVTVGAVAYSLVLRLLFSDHWSRTIKVIKP